MNWTHEAVLAEVRAVITEHAEVAALVSETTELVADLGIDSLGVMEVVAEIEDKFDLTISDAELRDVTTLGDVVRAIEIRLSASGRLTESSRGEGA
jgi:acyl carrier protein